MKQIYKFDSNNIEKSAKIEKNVFFFFFSYQNETIPLKQFGNSHEHIGKFTVSIIVALQTNRNPKL